MKKSLSLSVLILLVQLFLFSSCNKKDEQELIQSAQVETEAAGKNANDCCCCPAEVPTATSLSYSLNWYGPYQTVGVLVTVAYTNPEPNGSFRVVLRASDGSIDSVAIVPASYVAPGTSGAFELSYWVPYDDFPCRIQVNGRPANLDCPMRSKRFFDITLDVS